MHCEYFMGLCPVAQCACEHHVQVHLDYIFLSHILLLYTLCMCALHYTLDSDDDRDPEDLDPGTLCVLKYRPISSLVQSGAVRLVWPPSSLSPRSSCSQFLTFTSNSELCKINTTSLCTFTLYVIQYLTSSLQCFCYFELGSGLTWFYPCLHSVCF